MKKLKATFEVVRSVRSNSGWSWDDELGAGIGTDPTDAKVGYWNDYVEMHPLAEPFRDVGWIHLAAFDILCENSAPQGAHVFIPSQGTSQALNSSIPCSDSSSPPPATSLIDTAGNNVDNVDGTDEEKEDDDELV